ncbi:MAG: hypothetical protein ACYSR8_10380 [Planctomycetota bacterium]|jgi:hypothetical protein
MGTQSGNEYGQAEPPDGNDFIVIAAGSESYHSLALKSDGSIVGWGQNPYHGQVDPPDGNDFIAIAAGSSHSLALKSDGSIVGWGRNNRGQAEPPEGNDFIAIAAGFKYSLAIRRVAQPIEVELKLTPQMLNCSSKGKWLKAHVTLPEEIYPEDIDVNTPAVAQPPGIESEYIEIFDNGRGRFDVQIYFDRQSFCDAVPDTNDGYLDVTVIGSLLDGRKFQGSDTIKLKSKPWQNQHRKK